MPNKEQLEEMNKTAASIQAKQTQEKRAEMELANVLRLERNKAVADKAYMTELNLSSTVHTVCVHGMLSKKNGANIDVLFGGAETPMWNIQQIDTSSPVVTKVKNA